MKIRFIFNPASGAARRNRRFLASVRAWTLGAERDSELCVTDGPGHATVLAREAAEAGCPEIVAVGGDGTLNEVAQALIRSPAALGIVPCGSGNGLARYLNLPSSPARAIALLFESERSVAMIDAGLADGHPFFNAMGLGLDAEVSRRFNALARRGLPAYVRTVWAAYRRHKPEPCRIDDGRRHLDMHVLLVAVANSDQYGNNARIAPGARADDGLLDLVAVPPTGLVRGANLAVRLFLGTLTEAPGIRHLTAPRFRIERPASGLIHTDGETHEAGPIVHVAVIPQALRVLVPVRFLPARVSAASPAPVSRGPSPARASSSFALRL